MLILLPVLSYGAEVGNQATSPQETASEPTVAEEGGKDLPVKSTDDQDKLEGKEMAATSAASPLAASSGLDPQDEMAFDHIKDFIKRLDAANRKGVEYPLKAVETAIRSEFLRRTEGNLRISWVNKHKLKAADQSMARANLELLVAYADHLLTLCKKGVKVKDKQLAEMKMKAAKAIIDEANGHIQSGRGLAADEKAALTSIGKDELARRNRMLGHLLAGNDYRPIAVKNMDDYGKRYKEILSASAKEYDRLANAINRGAEDKKAPAVKKRAKK